MELSVLSYSVVLFSVLNYVTSAQTVYPYQAWMEDFPSSSNLYENTIFDISIPGSRLSGSIFDQLTNTSSVATFTSLGPPDYFGYDKISSMSSDEQKLWSARQTSSVLNQLRLGSRFLDLQIEQGSDNEYYAYNGLLGATVSTIISDIDNFLSNYGPEEIIIIYLHDFYGSDSSAMFQLFTNSNLNSTMVPNTMDLTATTLQQFIDAGKNIIAFTDATTLPSSQWFDSNYLYIKTDSTSNSTLGYIDELHDVRSFITSNIRLGWPQYSLNLIYWTFDIGASFSESSDYNSFYQFNIPLSFELDSFITSYPKLRFGNIILVDFIETSDVTEQIILLNYKYSLCQDDLTIWNNNITGCPSQTSLSTTFNSPDQSSICLISSSLDTTCPRSCGSCNDPVNIPGSECSDDTDCDSLLYSIYGNTGTCFQRESDQTNYIKESSFCKGLQSYSSCGTYSGADVCSDDGNLFDTSTCNNFCSSNYQCTDGYCNSEYSVCMTISSESTVSSTPSTNSDGEKYDQVISESAEGYRASVKALRSGNPDADYPDGEDDLECTEYNSDCFFENLEANPYVNSVLSLILLTIIFSIIFCVCFSCCCVPWCFCDRSVKKCCCKPCYGSGDEKENWPLYKKWGACVCLSIVMIIVIAFVIQGIVANSALHSHIFDTSNQDSFSNAANGLFNDVNDRFGSATNLTQYILDNIEDILSEVEETVGNNSTQQLTNSINGMHDVLNIMANNYSDGISITADAINPFTGNISNFTLRCDYCDSIYDTIIEVNDTLANEAGDSLDQITDTLNFTEIFVDAEETINDNTENFQNSINDILEISNDTQENYNDYMSTAEDFDEERELYVTLFFCLMLILLIFPCIGIFMKSKWCFKINWCLAMYCSSLWLLISVPFIFVTTLSADFCVRLDEFESALPDAQYSQLGRQIFNISQVNDASNVNILNQSVNTLQVIDTCFNGGSLLDVFDLSSVLNWTQYRSQLDDILNIDLNNYIAIDKLESFQTEIDTLSTDEYASHVDEFIATANNIAGCYCIYPNDTFSRSNLDPGTQCTPRGGNPDAITYWLSSSLECAEAFENASLAVQIERTTLPEAQMKIDTLKQDSRRVFAAYDNVYATANNLVLQLQNVTCLVYPLFDDFEEILKSFTNCGFLGTAYGNFKRVGCITIFNDFYFIGRAIVVIAFMCILIVFFSLCLDYVYAPWKEKQNYFGDDEPEKPVYIDDVELQTTQPDPMPVTPISPGMTNPDGFGRVASASPRSPVPDGDYGTIPMNQSHNNNDDDMIDEMDGQITGNNDEPVVPGNDEYPVLPQEQPMQMDGDYNNDNNWMDPNNYGNNNDGAYTVPQINNENGYAD